MPTLNVNRVAGQSGLRPFLVTKRVSRPISDVSIRREFLHGGMSLIDTDASIAIARRLSELLRENARLQAEVQALGGILRSAVLHREAPKAWSLALKQMRNTPEYRTVAEQYAEQIARLERSANAREIQQILACQGHPCRLN
jgi:hypothetical protein